MAGSGKRVGFLVTCLVDLIRPSVGFAAVKLLEQAGCEVEVPPQSCCGQPAFNSGDRATAREMAEQVIAAFEHCDYIVAPSGSCAGQVRVHYPELFKGDPNWQPRADAFAAKTHELTQFLVDVLGVAGVESRCDQGVRNFPGAGANVLLVIAKFPVTSRYDPEKVRVRFRWSARSVSR